MDIQYIYIKIVKNVHKTEPKQASQENESEKKEEERVSDMSTETIRHNISLIRVGHFRPGQSYYPPFSCKNEII